MIAIPVTQYAIDRWLESFAYRYDFAWWTHLLSMTIVNLLAFVAISWQSLRAAFANPVDALRE